MQSILAGSGLRRRRARHLAGLLLQSSRERIVECADGVRLLAHVTAPRAANGRTAMLLHGWEGSAESSYMLSAAARLWDEGYRIIRLNLRDHGDSHHLNRGIFHSCLLDEVSDAVAWAAAEYPGEAMHLVGFSLGGNFALRIAARPDGPALRRVAAVCPVLDPVETMYALDGGLPLYRFYFMRKWRRSLEKKARAFPDSYDFGPLSRFRSLQEMTGFLIARYTDFPDLMTYLRGYAITGERLRELRVPSTLLVADDDPVIPVAGLERIARPAALQVHRTRFGGHCGYIADSRMQTWLDDYLAQVLA